MKIKLLLFVLLTLYLQNCDSFLSNQSSSDKGGICLTFDDNYINQWYKTALFLKQKNMKATFFVSHIYNLSNDEINKLQKIDSLGFEIGCHGWNHLNAATYLETHTLNEYYEEEILPAISFMENYGLTPSAFAYPGGVHNDSLDQFLLQYFDILRGVTFEQVKSLTKNVDEIDEIFIKRKEQSVVDGLGIDIQYGISEEMLTNGLFRASEQDEIIILYAHCPEDSNAQHYQINKSYLEHLILKCEELDLKSYLVSEI
jgi:peptidoglycan/xylan/chitin deacetylase (PgdA/CDA1 family)